MWTALSDFLAKVVALIFNEVMSTPGETYEVEDQIGTIEIPSSDVNTTLDRYSM